MKFSARFLVALAGILLCPLSLAEIGGGISLYIGDTRGEFEFPGLEEVRGPATVTGGAARLDMHPNLSFELGVMDMSSFKADLGAFYTSAQIDTSLKQLSVVGRLPLNNAVSLRGRIGMAQWEAEEKFKSAFGTATDDDSGSDAFFGIGLDARFSDAVSGSAEYKVLEFSPTLFQQSTDVSYRTVLLGLHFHF